MNDLNDTFYYVHVKWPTEIRIDLESTVNDMVCSQFRRLAEIFQLKFVACLRYFVSHNINRNQFRCLDLMHWKNVMEEGDQYVWHTVWDDVCIDEMMRCVHLTDWLAQTFYLLIIIIMIYCFNQYYCYLIRNVYCAQLSFAFACSPPKILVQCLPKSDRRLYCLCVQKLLEYHICEKFLAFTVMMESQFSDVG